MQNPFDSDSKNRISGQLTQPSHTLPAGDGENHGALLPAEAPASVEDLQQLVSRIQAGSSLVKLGPRTYRTLARLVDSPRQAAVFTISELASALGVNASTLTRLSKRLGYAGFSEFQSVFRRHVAHGDDFYSERAGRFLANDGETVSGTSVLAKIAEDEQSNIAELVAGIDTEHLAQTARAMASARAIRVQGLRQHYPSACFLAYGLGMIREDVSLLNTAGAGIAHSFAQLKSHDMLVAIGHAPYTRETVDACTLASHYKLRIIAITDSYASPLAAPAENVLITPAGGRFFGNSTAASVILIEALLSMTAAELGQSAVDALKRHERVIDELGVAMNRT